MPVTLVMRVGFGEGEGGRERGKRMKREGGIGVLQGASYFSHYESEVKCKAFHVKIIVLFAYERNSVIFVLQTTYEASLS